MNTSIKKLVTMICLSCFTLAATQTMAATVFSEDFDASGGTLPGTFLSNSSGDANNVAQLEDIGGGDWAFVTQSGFSSPSSHQQSFFSTGSFARGDDIRCTFLAWGDPTKNSWQNIPFPSVASVNGPWRQNNTQISPSNQEACVSLWQHQPLRFSQAEWNTGSPLGTPYNNAWALANSKGSSILHQVGLGDTTGAYFQWSTDGGTTWNLEVDSRGQFGGTQATDLYLGWATSGAGVFIDEIVVETGPSPDLPGAPEPTPTPFPAPGPLLIEDFGAGPCDISNHWLVAIQDDPLFNGTGHLDIEEVAPGDCAVWTAGPSALSGATAQSVHGTNIHSFLSFDRGEDLRVTFRVWGDPSKMEPLCCWGGPFPANSMFGGPWHKGQFGLLFDNEAIVRYWGWNAVDKPHFSLPGDPWVGGEDQGTWMSNNWRTEFESSIDKATSMLIQVWLGNTHGAMLRWSKNDGTSWTVEHDFRGTESHGSGTSSNTVFLGWGTYSGAIFIDDIQVENNSRLGPPIGTPPPNGADTWVLY
jgi:hypothetical protein